VEKPRKGGLKKKYYKTHIKFEKTRAQDLEFISVGGEVKKSE